MANNTTNAKETSYAPLSKTIADKIKNSIFIEKKYPPNSKLPNERTLAAELNVGRNSLREAIKLLVADNILVVKRSSGTFVSPDPGVAQDTLGLGYIKNHKNILNQWLEVRLLLEPASAKYAAERATDEDIDQMEMYANKCFEILENGGTALDAIHYDEKFHEFLALATHNELLSKITPFMANSFSDSVQIAYASNKDTYLIENMKYHKEIIKFIKMRDGDGAALSMRMHILNAFKFYDE